jgi:superfamily II DNA or RNA helicase
MSVLRKYQLRDFNNIVKSWELENNILYQLPTGGGKSVLIEHLILNYNKEKILVLAHKRELVFQMKERLELNGLKVGIIIGNVEENTDSNIVVASIRTVTGDKRISTILEQNFDKIIIDEAHHIRTSSYENVLDKYTYSTVKAHNASLFENKDYDVLKFDILLHVQSLHVICSLQDVQKEV